MGGMNVPTVRTAHLELVSLSPAFIEALLAGRRAGAETEAGLKLADGWPDEHDSRFLRLRLEQIRQNPESQQWLVRAMVLRGPERLMIGHVGFHGPPETVGRAEMGYTVMPEFRRRGYAIEAATALMEWASQEHGTKRFFVSISPENGPSLAMAAKMGFTKIGEQTDEEDGLEFVFELVRT